MSSTTIFAVIVAISNAIVAIFTYMLSVHNTKHDKNTEKKNEIKTAEEKLKDVCDNGTLSDLLDATKQLGDSKK